MPGNGRDRLREPLDAVLSGTDGAAGEVHRRLYGLAQEAFSSPYHFTTPPPAPLLPRKLDLRLEELARNKAFACARYAEVGPAEHAGSGGDRH